MLRALRRYWIHRWVHVSPFLYKHLHSTHHRLYITYAMGALYNHPLEALLLDTLGAGISAELSGMSCGMATWFFTFATLKTVRAPLSSTTGRCTAVAVGKPAEEDDQMLHHFPPRRAPPPLLFAGPHRARRCVV